MVFCHCIYYTTHVAQRADKRCTLCVRAVHRQYICFVPPSGQALSSVMTLIQPSQLTYPSSYLFRFCNLTIEFHRRHYCTPRFVNNTQSAVLMVQEVGDKFFYYVVLRFIRLYLTVFYDHVFNVITFQIVFCK